MNYQKSHVAFISERGLGKCAKNQKTDFSKRSRVTLILKIVTQIHTNGALMFGKKKI